MNFTQKFNWSPADITSRKALLADTHTKVLWEAIPHKVNLIDPEITASSIKSFITNIKENEELNKELLQITPLITLKNNLTYTKKAKSKLLIDFYFNLLEFEDKTKKN